MAWEIPVHKVYYIAFRRALYAIPCDKMGIDIYCYIYTNFTHSEKNLNSENISETTRKVLNVL